MCFPFQVLPDAVNNDQPEGHWEDIPQLVGDAVWPDRLQDRDHHNPNAAYHGMAEYQRPRPGVSNLLFPVPVLLLTK
jgi:hypothetical protein